MASTVWPSFKSRTVPTKHATAPTLGLSARNAATSVLRSKSASWTRTRVISASRDRREKRNLAAFRDASRRIRHFVVAGHAQRAALGERFRPCTAARAQPGPHVADTGHAVRHIHALVRHAQ